MPILATREELYDALHERLDRPPRRLTAYDRDVMVQSAARDASIGGFRLRPGLVAEMLRFYDQLRRQARNVARFEELLDESLSRDSEHDRGAARMLAQARVLAETFRGYECRVEASGACDEHRLREFLWTHPSSNPIRDIVVTLGDWIADPSGLYLADFELLTRLPGVEAIDIVATTGLLESGFHQRIHDWLPGIEELEASGGLARTPRPVLAIPDADPDRPVFVHRDREEELLAVVHRLKAPAGSAAADRDSLDRVAVVFKRPLPYLYLAREVFGTAGLAYQAFDALPLAAEPFAAALDLLLEFVESDFTRRSTVALLRSPHFTFRDGDRSIGRDEIAALDRELSEQRYLGGLDRLQGAADPKGAAGPKGRALEVARTVAVTLAPLLTPAPASSQFRCLIAFLDAYEAPIDENASRLRRGRAAVRDVLAALAAAHAAHDDPPMAIPEMAASIRRWIEERTLVPESGSTGVQFVDDQAARYGEFDEIAVVGLIEGEWPERPKRNIFYPASLLASLGWPTEKDRRGAAEARFRELLQSPLERVRVSTVSLDDEALVEPSTFVDEIPRAKLPTEKGYDPFSETTDPKKGSYPFSDGAEAWASMRAARSSREADAFHGETGPLPEKTWSVSALETYLGCPFKFFAQYVLRLAEEPDDEEVMDPRTQGQFVHEVFEAFFKRWQHEGHQAITPDTIDTARTIFAEVVEQFLARLSDTEAALERTRLLGSPAAAGLGEAVFRMEAERPVPVVARLLEHRLKDEFVFETAAGPRRMSVNGKADRIDLLADGTFRVIDYKMGWPPNRARALQLPIYGLSAEQSLKGHLGRQWTLGEAAYLAFKGPKRVVGLFASADDRAKVLADAQQRFADTVDAIEAGHFPPTPDDVFRCETCTYAAVCRKDYVGDV